MHPSCIVWRSRAGMACRALAASLLVATAGRAADPLPVAVDDSAGVLVSGIDESFPLAEQAVKRAKETSGRDYRVVVVKTAAAVGDARALLDRLVDEWRKKAADGSGGFDSAADVSIVLAIDDRQLAMDAPSGLEVASGLDRPTIEGELIRKIFVPRAKDGLYDQGLAELIDATESWVATRADEQIARAEAARRFRTQTLPLGLATLGGAAVVGGLAAGWLRHARRLKLARDKLAAFKRDVVALSDLLDTEQERHRMLPHTDPDFTTAMEGQTRAAYDNVQAAIRGYRERWLGLMEIWEKAQAKVDAERFLGVRSAEAAIALLDSAEARPPLSDVTAACRAPLDLLEQAHEQARARRDHLAAELTQADARLAALAGRGRSAAAFQAAMAAAARERDLAAEQLERDPIAARGRLDATAAALADLVARVDALEAADDRRARCVADAGNLDARIRDRRAEGWLLAEQGANPDDRLVRGRAACDTAAQLLDSGEIDAANAQLEQAEQALAEAHALLESIVAARSRAEELLVACAARLESLAAGRDAAARALEQLVARSAESAWADVADNVDKAAEGLARAGALLQEARTALDPGRQEYFRAVALLEETVRQEEWVDRCHAAVTARRDELDGLRAELPGRLDRAAERIAGLERRLHRQHTDRARANERCREAARLLDVSRSLVAVERPDLRQAAQAVDAAETAAARSDQLADDDDRLARQADSEVEETDAVVRRVAAWYAEGVQADVRGAAAALDRARSLLGGQRYEDAIAAAGEAANAARAAYAAATAEAERRRVRRQEELRRRQLEESFSRMSRGAGPWVIQLPGGMFSGPDPWRSLGSGGPGLPAPPSRSAGGGWSRDTAQVGW